MAMTHGLMCLGFWGVSWGIKTSNCSLRKAQSRFPKIIRSEEGRGKHSGDYAFLLSTLPFENNFHNQPNAVSCLHVWQREELPWSAASLALNFLPGWALWPSWRHFPRECSLRERAFIRRQICPTLPSRFLRGLSTFTSVTRPSRGAEMIVKR